MFDYIEYSPFSENRKNTDINNVFIPYRPVFEMELLISLFLIDSRLEELTINPTFLSNKEEFQKLLHLDTNDDGVSKDILDRFYTIIEKIRPIAHRSRKIQINSRIGNVNAYTKSRIPAFFALDHLKFKILLLRNFLKKLRLNNYDLSIFPLYNQTSKKMLESILFGEYYSRCIKYYRLISPKKEYIGRRDNNILNSVDTEILESMWSHISKEKHNPRVDYILRGIKSNLFVISTIFNYMDVPNPFEYRDGHVLEIYDALTSQDFIPNLIPSMSQALVEENFRLFEDLSSAFEFFIVRILEGIKNAVQISSNNLLNLSENDTIYYTGNLEKV